MSALPSTSALHSDDDHVVLTAITSSTRDINTILRCLSFSSSCVFNLSSAGILIKTEEARSMHANAFLDKNLFSLYRYTRSSTPPASNAELPDDVDPDAEVETEVSISLFALMECLQIFGFDTRERWGKMRGGVDARPVDETPAASVLDPRPKGFCKFSYDGQGSPLKLVLDKDGVTTSCELTTYEPFVPLELPLKRDQLAMKIIMKASSLHDALLELDGPTTSGLVLAANPTAPFFTLSSSGSLGSTSIEFSNDRSLIEAFQVPDSLKHTYKFSMIKHVLKTSAVAVKVSMRTDVDGILSMQFMVEHEGGHACFIEFRFAPFVIGEELELGGE